MKTTPTELDPPRTIGQASVESQELFKFLQTTAPGQLITYIELNAASKVDVQAVPTVLATARRMMQREKKVTYGTVRGVGIKHLDNEEIPDEANGAIHRAQKVARNGRKTLRCAVYSELSPEAKIRHTVTDTVLGFMERAARPKVLSLAEQGARVSTDGRLELGDIASLFGKK